ncbi:SPOR domain-containing protein [Sphingomonas sp. R86521]|uniref:tetratricopeptide repeat protein n=1 Tax=Sphingomonas sp. R86521 TaxID=3093860 RepID=UPI0036D229C6
MIRPLTFTLTAMLLLAASPCAVAAQEVVQALPGTTDADRLGDVMRQLASSPQNVDALLHAGELSIDVGDLSGAAALFARAEKVDPRNGRVKAGMASILVRSERPGEALRYFSQAEALGLDPRRFAADRALAYDLVGQQDRAQRDYRVALRDTPDDETVRRYALSLGISGKQELALKQLAPLLQKTDRGAWRARAFILAMTGDVPAAERIATTMMPAGMAQGLLPFFARLPSLPAGDRAFAVHFGEIHASPERLVDARMVPPLPMLGPDPTAPVMMAAAQPVTVVPVQKSQKASKRDRRQASRVEMAAVRQGSPTRTVQPTPSPVMVAQAAVRTAPSTVQAVPAPVVVAQAPVRTAPVTVPSSPTPVVVAQAPARTAVPATAYAYRAPTTLAQVQTQSATRTETQAETRTVAPVLAQSVPARMPPTTASGQLPATMVAQMAAMPAPSSAPVTRASSMGLPATPLSPGASSVASAQPLPSPGFSSGATAVTAAPSVSPSATFSRPTTVAPVQAGAVATPAPVAVAAIPTPAAEVAAAPESIGRTGDDSILARIVAGLSIPASELDVAPVVAHPTTGAAPAVAIMSPDAQRVIAEAQAKADRDAAAKAVLAKKLAAEKAIVAKKAADKKAVADKKALAEKKAAAAEKAIADKEAAEEKRIARANPERIWVQVAGGATAGDLPKAWKAVKAKAPTVFAARGGWTTPLRATNRVLAGPFKTDAEARSFVNQLAKSGVSAFTFTSDEGQAVTRLPTK